MEKLSTCLALYGCDKSLTAQTWFGVAEKYFHFVGVAPTVCIVGFEDEDFSERTLRDWKSARNEIAALTDVPDIQGISCYVETPGAVDFTQWEVCAAWLRPLLNPLPEVFFGYTHNDGPLSIENCEYLSRLIVNRYPVAYGIGYQRDALLGPDAYAMGVVVDRGRRGPGELEAKRIELWQREYMAPRDDEPPRFRYLAGMIRDVYPVSILTSLHLSQIVEGRSLAEWIHAAPSHGTLKAIGARNWFWTVSTTDIPSVREMLRASGLLIADGQRGCSR
jgi:hypothetical protein